MHKALFIILLALPFSTIAQQERLITGRVTNAQTGDGIFGATLFVQGTKKGVVTDFNGAFTYLVKAKNITTTVLEVSYLGYKTANVTMGYKDTFSIALLEDIESLKTVVITSSYGTKKLKEEVVGSISSVKVRDLATEQPATSVDELLQGQVAGVLIELNPQLGQAARIDIRGQGSLTPLNGQLVGTSTQPLIIVDGVILGEELGIDGSNFFDAGTGALSENFLNPLARVGIQDIEDVTVLKDAAAVGIYGANGANGVILITTKKGNKGKTVLTSSVQSGVSLAFDRLKYMSGEQYSTLHNIYNTNNGDLNNVRPWNGVNTDWFELLNQTGTFLRLSAGANGGTEKFRFRGSVTYQNRQESQVANDFNQLNAGFNADYITKKLQIGMRLTPSYITKNNPNTLFNFAVDPTIPVRDDNGVFTPFASFGNPVAVSQQNRAFAETYAVLGSLNLNYQFNDKVRFSALYGADFANKTEDRFQSGLNGSGQFNGGDLGRRLVRGRDSYNWNFNSSVSYSNTWKEKHSLDAIVGLETRGEKSLLNYVSARNFAILSSPQPVEDAEFTLRENDSFENYGRSGFSQISYDFKKKYFLLANFRADQSSAFGDDNNLALNGGLGASWVLSKEAFLSGNRSIDFLRLRLSYGSTGNSRIGSYRALGLYNVNNIGYNGVPRFANLAADAPNPNLGWEKNNKFNLGVDMNLFSKLKITLEVFRDYINDVIVSRNVLPETGYDNVQINGASMTNSGIEFSLQADWINTGNFSWNTNFNIATLDNVVTDLIDVAANFSAAQVARSQQIGFATSAIWGFESLGIDPATGRELFNVDGNVYDAAYVRQNFTSADWKPIGDSQPDFYGGMRNNFRYKDFNMNIIMSYTYGADQLIGREVLDNYNSFINRNLGVNAFYNAWRAPGNIATMPALTNSVSVSNSSRYVYDASNVQLRSVSLSYNLPVNNWKLPLRTCSVNANGSNLFYWFADRSPAGRNGIAELRNVYPQMRTFSLGINTTF
jgi:TonB-linked SusC/RagA family outer membrane protein